MGDLRPLPQSWAHHRPPIVSSLDWAASAAPFLEPLFGGGANRCSRDGQQRQVEPDQSNDQPFNERPHGLEALVLFERLLVHIEVAGDLDLERVHPMRRASVGARGKAAGIRAIAGDTLVQNSGDVLSRSSSAIDAVSTATSYASASANFFSGKPPVTTDLTAAAVVDALGPDDAQSYARSRRARSGDVSVTNAGELTSPYAGIYAFSAAQSRAEATSGTYGSAEAVSGHAHSGDVSVPTGTSPRVSPGAPATPS